MQVSAAHCCRRCRRDGVYHPALFNDRLLLGLKGTMSEAELHIIRARLDGGIRNKAARGELRRGLPVGFVWGEQDGEVLFHPDEAVTGAIRAVFERFAEFGSARRVWLWFRSEGLSFPLQIMPAGMPGPIRWVAPTYHAVTDGSARYDNEPQSFERLSATSSPRRGLNDSVGERVTHVQ